MTQQILIMGLSSAVKKTLAEEKLYNIGRIGSVMNSVAKVLNS